MNESENKYSVIIPSFNEELFIEKNIKEIRKIMPGSEIIVVDCGSNDQTKNICRREGVKVIDSKRRRGTQLNQGTKNAFELFEQFFT